MHQRDSLGTRHITATPGESHIAAVPLTDHSFITVGSLKDGGAIVTLSTSDPETGILTTASLELSAASLPKAELYITDGMNHRTFTPDLGSVAAVEVADGHFITVGRRKDGGIIATSSALDPVSGELKTSSLELDPPPSSKMKLDMAA
jgi:hypothetical protein